MMKPDIRESERREWPTCRPEVRRLQAFEILELGSGLALTVGSQLSLKLRFEYFYRIRDSDRKQATRRAFQVPM